MTGPAPSCPGGPRPGDPVPGVAGARIVAVLKADRYAETYRVRLADGRSAIFKKSVVVVPPGVRIGPAARRLARREADHLERLADVEGVPALLGRPAPDTFLRCWIDGDELRQLRDVPDPVFPGLRTLLAAIHERGIAYADLAKEENIIVEEATEAGGEAGRPWLIDFQISAADDTWLAPVVPMLQQADRFYLARHVKRRRPDQLTDAERALLDRGRGVLHRLHRMLLKKPYNVLTRRVVRRWSGTGEGRRADEPRGRR